MCRVIVTASSPGRQLLRVAFQALQSPSAFLASQPFELGGGSEGADCRGGSRNFQLPFHAVSAFKVQ